MYYMSIATLKKKTKAQYKNLSVGSKNGFSLNGTHRSQGYVGQTSLSRSLPRTLMKGNAMKGHGGCCGTFNISPVVSSAVNSLNNSNVVKSSVLSTKGMVSTHFRWIQRPQPFTSVKPDNNNNINTQYDYINTQKYNAINATIDPENKCYSYNSSNTVCRVSKPCENLSSLQMPSFVHIITKPESSFLPKNQTEYINSIQSRCTKNNIINVKNNNKGTPFSC